MSTGCGRGFVGLLSPPGSGVLAVAFQEDFGPVGPMLVGEEPQKLNNAGGRSRGAEEQVEKDEGRYRRD